MIWAFVGPALVIFVLNLLIKLAYYGEEIASKPNRKENKREKITKGVLKFGKKSKSLVYFPLYPIEILNET